MTAASRYRGQPVSDGTGVGEVYLGEANPRVSLLADHWDENWTRLGWVMVRGVARIEAPGGASEVLRAKYIQYDTTDLGGPVVAIEPQIINWWTWT